MKHRRLNRSICNVYQNLKNPNDSAKFALIYLKFIQRNDSAKPNHTHDVQSQPKYYNNLMNSNIVTSRLDLSK